MAWKQPALPRDEDGDAPYPIGTREFLGSWLRCRSAAAGGQTFNPYACLFMLVNEG
ncbi:MAG TPA: hypothetical protein PLV20_03825 [Anaerolineaceae bacterium]|nr:hypothetical protein [Anaerolineaceae bacterium]